MADFRDFSMKHPDKVTEASVPDDKKAEHSSDAKQEGKEGAQAPDASEDEA